MLALAQCWFTRKHVPLQSGRRNRDGVFRGECRHCRRLIVSWDRSAWHLAEGFNLLQLTQGAEEAFLFLVDTRDDMVVARFPIDHLETEAEIRAFAQQIRVDYQMDSHGNPLELRDSRKGKRRRRPAGHAAAAEAGGQAAAADADALTGLPGRASFEIAFPLACANAQLRRTHLALAFVDIDGLDPINRAHGLDGGDAVVRHVAEQLAAMGQCNTYLSRNRGLEFIVMFPGAGASLAQARLEHLRDAIVGTGLAEAPGARVSISCGLTEVPIDGDPRSALRAADLALQRAKANGRNAVIAG